LGFCPLSLFATAREEEKGKWGRRKEERGARLRSDAADAPRPETTPVAMRKGEDAVCVGEGAGLEQKHLHCRERLRRREHLRHATVYPEPATTTPSPQREHPAAIFFFPPSLFAFQCWTGDVEARRWYPYLPVCWPSSRRPAATRRVGAPGHVMPPSLPSLCDEPLCSPVFEPCVICCRGRGVPPRRLELRPGF
jgi:hypothetical protein